jgi:hypothetical protein
MRMSAREIPQERNAELFRAGNFRATLQHAKFQ